jgi:hypothetical protein
VQRLYHKFAIAQTRADLALVRPDDGSEATHKDKPFMSRGIAFIVAVLVSAQAALVLLGRGTILI